MSAEPIGTYATFTIQGRLKRNTGVQISAKGTSYLRPKLEVAQKGNTFTRDYQVVAFGDVAEEIGDNASDGDIIQLAGEIQLQKNQKSGFWEYVLVARSFKMIEQALQNNIEAVKEAFDATEDDAIPF